MKVTDVSTIIGVIVAVVVAWVASLIGSYKRGFRRAKKDFRDEALQNRYRLIYAPLRALLLSIHITTGTAILYPRISQRVKRAWPYLRRLNLKHGFHILSYKYGKETHAEVEFGGGIPMKQIEKIVEENGEWAGAKLMELIQWASRSRYEFYDRPNHSLTQEEFALVKHIFDEYIRLDKRLMPK